MFMLLRSKNCRFHEGGFQKLRVAIQILRNDERYLQYPVRFVRLKRQQTIRIACEDTNQPNCSVLPEEISIYLQGNDMRR